MYSTAKSYLSRRAPAKPWFHDNKTSEEKSDDEKKSSLHDAESRTPAGDWLYGMVNKWDDYTDGLAKNYNDIVDNGNGNIISGIINTTIKDVGKIVNSAKNTINETFGTPPSSGVVAKPVIYSNWSPASKLFGMSQETAFGEHMANTAHQREVADLKAAGLNPVLGISGSGATSVSGSTGASSSAEKVQDNSMLDVLGATAAVITAVATKNPMYGYMVSNIFKAFE